MAYVGVCVGEEIRHMLRIAYLAKHLKNTVKNTVFSQKHFHSGFPLFLQLLNMHNRPSIPVPSPQEVVSGKEDEADAVNQHTPVHLRCRRVGRTRPALENLGHEQEAQCDNVDYVARFA